MTAREVIRRCWALAERTDEPGHITRTFLSPAMRNAHRLVRDWMESAGMRVRMDAVGNLRGLWGNGPRLMIGSHLDTVPRAGAFDGTLGIAMGIALVERKPACAVEVVAFSEEESGRFIGSRALVGDPVMDSQVLEAIRAYGLDPAEIPAAAIGMEEQAYLEIHIEQGPVLESVGLPLGVVEAIAGQSRGEVRFRGVANHAGTTPMRLRRDAVAAGAEWIGLVESIATMTPGLVATVGRVQTEPGAGNVIAGLARASLDVRHPIDEIREAAVRRILDGARKIGERRGIIVECEGQVEQPAVAMQADVVQRAVRAAGHPVHRMISGAGHDAMILARKVPASMLFVRSPGGISHHRDECVLEPDVEAALQVGAKFLEQWSPA